MKVLINIRTFFRLAKQAEQYFKTERPDVVLIDYPGLTGTLPPLSMVFQSITTVFLSYGRGLSGESTYCRDVCMLVSS